MFGEMKYLQILKKSTFSPHILTPDGEDMEKLKRIQNFKGIDDIDKVCIEK